MNRLLLIDGNAVLHRAFHAIPPLNAPDGSMVNAVYGFAAMVLRLHHDLAPSHVAVAFDRPAPTFRKKLFKDYQIKRPKMDDGLIPQIPKVHDLVSAFGIPIFEQDGFEADDVIGTICASVTGGSAHKKHAIDQVIIVTGDRDILQLVEDDRVLVYMPVKGLTEAKMYHEKDVVERLGVYPDKVADFKGLAGDQSDNYPGVEGIGPKTAVDILTSFDTVENLYARGEKGDWGALRESVVDKLKRGKESALLSKTLATIRRDVPITIDLYPLSGLDTNEAREMLETMHFHSLLKRLKGDIGASNTGKKTGNKNNDAYVKKQEHKQPGEQQELF